MTLPELVRLRDQIDGLIKTRAASEREQLRARIEELMNLEGARAARSKSSARGDRRLRARGPRSANGGVRKIVPPKYRGPAGETWSGRGLTPRWLMALEKAGKKRDAFLIQR